MNYTRIFTGTYFEKHGSFGIEKNTLTPPPGRALIPWKRSDIPGAVCRGNKFDLDKHIKYAIRGALCMIKLNMPIGKYNIQLISTLNGDIMKTEVKEHKSGEAVLQSPEYREDIVKNNPETVRASFQ